MSLRRSIENDSGMHRMTRRSASSIMASAIRSLMLAPGLARSSLTQTSTRGSKSRLIRRCGVSPIVARIVSAFIWCLPFR